MTKPEIGQGVKLSRKVTEADVEAFSELSLDRNPVHFDDEFAARTFFGRRIAHGMCGAALISGCLTALMGPGNIWLTADLKFVKPIFIGTLITCELKVAAKNRRGVATIDVCITDEQGLELITGRVESMKFHA